MRIGLLGGSFDPPHEGHRALSLKALHRLRLDQVWWLVSPGNPLKDRPSATLARRHAAAAALARHPRIAVTDIEAAIGSPYTADTIAWLRRRRPGVTFVWLMGADNLASFHRWRRWRDIMKGVPIAIADRPGRGQADLAARAFRHFVRFRTPEAKAGTLAGKRPPAWVFLRGPRVDMSSSTLRQRKVKGSS